jgi:UDPglucose 6-dehydrogenase
MGLDRRIGPKFLHPGPGYGGSCFPKDTHALLRIAADNGYDMKIVRAVLEVNAQRRLAVLNKIENLLPGLEGRTIAGLGLAFKPNTDDIRESPAVDICRLLLDRGAHLRVFDPAAMTFARKELGETGVHYASDMYDAAKGSDLLVLFTEWNQFRKLDLERMASLLSSPRMVDCRNIYDPAVMRAAGFQYVSVGR